ncbi:MAG TPA: DUF2911 domain-containing protein [Sphingobacteriaceae bacterium]|nr:DUF2911 domain-containing protein [Sphingobacteriaceae bacterium]
MKRTIFFAAMISLFTGFAACAQRPSPPAKVSEITNNGVTISIDYSQPGIKGRTIGKEIAPYGKVWRTGANEATVFEVNKSVKVNGKILPAGKYGFYSVPGEKEWILIFNKSWKQSGTVYEKSEDVLRIVVKPIKSASFTERMTFAIAKNGRVSLIWGNSQVDFKVI